MSLEEAEADDVIETINKIQVAFDHRIVGEVKKLTLDFKEDGLILLGVDNCC